MLAMSRILFEFQEDEVLRDYCMCNDPAYGCRARLACPFSSVRPGSPKADFNTKMSSVRESVEWSFGLIKGQWGYINYDKKIKLWLTAVLLTNCRTCLEPTGTPISKNFSVNPPSIDTNLPLD
ncbi:hypothetical protein SPRG_14159 [Saprolegnia parasitica CBS 223.65]|uniref:DDE Tnp4 domain-containing protein n=1 Tax=Saprolegnia parasitica (strain CBS 223.65) TaxID=695850 RepID=A0A067C0A9_SAPPC|nr:hypothetical protein SPRG_14159 [Saprolegnia parasitica CBS 223.65]KDO20011.1 hypothetical protein SPRG_14159 [Saprolegnia parasitica CBS 223.65]|eukprot:XP_012209247.1 hypothetical protein SPRG_14159 [Saprolegnia parasitica CBS 223.65]